MKRRFLYQFFISVLTVFAVGSCLYFALCKGLRHTNRDSIGKLNYLLNDTTRYNTVFVGSSRVHTAIDPLIFDSITGMLSFNAGVDGIRMPEMDIIIRKYIHSHGTPKNIFINIDEATLDPSKGVWYFPQYYPYINDTDFNGLIKLEPRLKFGKYAPALAVTYMDDPLKNLGLIGLLRPNKDNGEMSVLRGFEPTPPHVITDRTVPTPAWFVGKEEEWKLLDETLSFCNQHNMKIFLLIAPMYAYLTDPSRVFVQRLTSLASRHDAEILNFFDDKNFSSRTLFADRAHLNLEGARIYSRLLAERVRGEMLK